MVLPGVACSTPGQPGSANKLTKCHAGLIYIYIYIMILLQTFSFHSVSQFIANVSFLSFHIISQIPASQIFTVLIRFFMFHKYIFTILQYFSKSLLFNFSQDVA